ncbi:Alpha/Beta hydrolase protein [Aspergillus spectabilis]
MSSNTDSPVSPSAKDVAEDLSGVSEQSPAAIAARGNEITGLEIFQPTTEDITPARVAELLSEMHEDKPTGGMDISYGDKDTQHLRYWRPSSPTTSKAPLILYIHGGSWRVGTYLDSIGSAKVPHLTSQGYAFATVNFSLVPSVTVEEQVQEIANALAYLVQNANSGILDFDPNRVILMGHSSGAHVVTLLGTDNIYLQNSGIPIQTIRAVIALDGSNYNALAEITDSPGPIAQNLIAGLGSDPERLRAMSPTYHTRAPNAAAFLLLHVQRRGDIRQAVEFVAALEAAGTEAALHVFEGEWFEGHVRILLELGDPTYPATVVLDEWLRVHVPMASSGES